MNIKITKKGNVKVDGTKYVFVSEGGCGGCAFRLRGPACQAAPCSGDERKERGLPAQGGNFADKGNKL
jgi:hypothetical protein